MHPEPVQRVVRGLYDRFRHIRFRSIVYLRRDADNFYPCVPTKSVL